mmetsp:Transcript_41575/g.36944  ORF Transcript_41575/g.36944 Transcript_41575/m.36944 type:complete len:243 (+) Transcript_41575:1398-2126(+)
MSSKSKVGSSHRATPTHMIQTPNRRNSRRMSFSAKEIAEMMGGSDKSGSGISKSKTGLRSSFGRNGMISNQLLVPDEDDSQKNSKKKRKSSLEEAQERTKLFEKRKIKYGNKINSLFAGEIFGQIAAGSKVHRRTATVMAYSQKVELLVMDGEEYSLIKDKYDVKKNKMLEFMMKNIPEVEKIYASSIIEGLLQVLKYRYYAYGNHIINEGEIGNTIFLLYEGSIELTKTLSVRETNKSFGL